MEEIINLFESSSDSEDEFLLMFLSGKRKRRMSRVHGFVTNVIENYTEKEFKDNLRLTKETSNYLIKRYEESDSFKENCSTGRKPIDARKQMLSFLWFASNKNSYREVCNLFDMSISSFFKHLDCVLDFFHKISKEFIRFPTSENDKQLIASKFESISSFKNVLGCIDGSYIYIRKPAHKIRSTYTNRHDLLSITLQAVCDADKKFMDVFIGSPSKIHDARIFDMSSISSKLPDICGQHYHLLGDAAYPIREYLLTPYKDYGMLTAKQRRFNLKHAQTRVKIENAFQLLKQRFRQLVRLDFFTVLKMCKFVMACCVLHNICIERGDLFEIGEAELEEVPECNVVQDPAQRISSTHTSDNRRNIALRRLGEIKRDNIANSFK